MDYSIFVGDLAVDVTDLSLQEAFRTYFPSVRGAKVITDMTSNRSKGYGFVRFGDEDERNRSITEMQGQIISGRPIRVSIATAKRPASFDRPQTTTPGQPEDLSNTTLFIGALSSSVTEDELKGLFGRYGPIVYCKIPTGGTAPKNCAFVQFVARPAAEQALQGMHGQIIGGSAVRVSWGKNNSKPYTLQPAAASSVPYYSGAMYAPSAPLPTYPAYSPPAVDPYAAYHTMAQPVANPYPMQAYQPKQEVQQGHTGQAEGQSIPEGGLPAHGKTEQAEIKQRNADFMQRNKVSLLGHLTSIAEVRRAGVH